MSFSDKTYIDTFSFNRYCNVETANYPADYVGEKNEPVDDASKSLTTQMEYVTAD